MVMTSAYQIRLSIVLLISGVLMQQQQRRSLDLDKLSLQPPPPVLYFDGGRRDVGGEQACEVLFVKPRGLCKVWAAFLNWERNRH